MKKRTVSCTDQVNVPAKRDIHKDKHTNQPGPVHSPQHVLLRMVEKPREKYRKLVHHHHSNHVWLFEPEPGGLNSGLFS